MDSTRRQLLAVACSVGAGVVLLGCDGKNPNEEAEKGEEIASAEVTATEDLMREHGVLRRALLVYQETAVKLRTNAGSIAPEALQKTAKLFRAFGEEYHEKKLEETHIFPALKNANSPAAAYVGVLTAQHQRGRELTEYILAVFFFAGAVLALRYAALPRWLGWVTALIGLVLLIGPIGWAALIFATPIWVLIVSFWLWSNTESPATVGAPAPGPAG